MAPPTSGSAAPVHKQLILANPREFCAGVEHAIVAMEHAIDYCRPPVLVRHIIHNQAGVDRREAKQRRFRTIDTAIAGGQSRIGMAAIKAPTGGTNTAFDGPRAPGIFSLLPRFRLAEAGHSLQ
jgi:hypothetical protein